MLPSALDMKWSSSSYFSGFQKYHYGRCPLAAQLDRSKTLVTFVVMGNYYEYIFLDLDS